MNNNNQEEGDIREDVTLFLFKGRYFPCAL
nr:MAG TPA: hypothetical protein [Ackermannviridae sp.]